MTSNSVEVKLAVDQVKSVPQELDPAEIEHVPTDIEPEGLAIQEDPFQLVFCGQTFTVANIGIGSSV